MSKFDQYAMDAEKLEKGVRLPLLDREGKHTDDWVSIRSVYSFDFQKARMEARRKLSEDPNTPEEDLYLDFQASMICDWSNDIPCTLENVRNWLKTAPHEGARVEEVAEKRALFFPEKGVSSLTGASKKSTSKASQEAPKRATAGT